MTTPPDWPNINYAWSGLLVEELVRLDVAGFVLSPGSRNAPLSISIARHPEALYWTHFDERGAAFFALGLAKQTGRPAVLVCTSGSAAANYWPAVVEASAAGVPLVIVTADRPPELLDCGANQAIDQPGLYGGYVRWEATLPCPAAAIDPAFVLTTVDQAVRRSLAGEPGPVHLNCMFREPLSPAEDGSIPDGYLDSLGGWTARATPYTEYTGGYPRLNNLAQARLVGMVQECAAGLLVVGALDSGGDTAQVAALACQLGWPVFADICAGLRGYPGVPSLLEYADLVLLDDALADTWRPSLVLHVGGPVTSKRIQSFLERVRPAYIRAGNGPARRDPGHIVSMHCNMAPAEFCMWLAACMAGNPAPEIPATLLARDNACAAVLAAWEGEQVALSEILVARILADLAPSDSLLFLGNSMPVRLMDTFGVPRAPGVDAAANRGASGIDGNLAAAAGMAVAADRPVTALLGDLTLLHDLNSLAFLRDVESPFVLVVLNNDGGGIFHHLPIAAHDDVFETCFGTPHGLTFASAASQFSIPYQRPADISGFATAYGAAKKTPGPTLIEVVLRRGDSHAQHQALTARLRDTMRASEDNRS